MPVGTAVPTVQFVNDIGGTFVGIGSSIGGRVPLRLGLVGVVRRVMGRVVVVMLDVGPLG